jgi:hypothetical protein
MAHSAVQATDECVVSRHSNAQSDMDARKFFESSPLAVLSYLFPMVNGDDQSFAFFFKNHVLNSAMYHPGNDHVIASIKVFGTASLSKQRADKCLYTTAQHQYATAPSLTKLTLRDPQLVTRDETLLSILVLTDYETLEVNTEHRSSKVQI